jgi:hypothetical protein
LGENSPELCEFWRGQNIFKLLKAKLFAPITDIFILASILGLLYRIKYNTITFNIPP